MAARRANKATTSAPVAAPKCCAIYTRKSTAQGLEQEFNSLDAQREACERYIDGRASEGWVLADGSYSDGGYTGANLERPGFARLMDDIERKRIDIVVVYKVDRLSRSLLDFAQVMSRFNAAGVAFVSVTQNFSTADAMGRLTLNMLMSFAEFEREMIAERTRDKIVAARRKGKWTGGPVPLGYDIVNKKLVVNDVEADGVRAIYDLYLEYRSTLEVARTLNDRGYPVKRRTRKSDAAVRVGSWDAATVGRLLRNPIYGGWIGYRDQRFEGEHDAIIDRGVFARVQRTLDGHNRRGKSCHNEAYLLSGVIRCACCGNAYTTASTRKKGQTYRYYRCVTRDKRGRDACPGQPLPAEAIESFVIEQIRERVEQHDFADEFAGPIRERIRNERDRIDRERRALVKGLARLEGECERLSAAIADATVSPQTALEAQLVNTAAELDNGRVREQELARRLDRLADLESESQWVERTLRDFPRLWDVMTAANRRRLLQALVEQINVDEPAGRVEVRLADLATKIEVEDDVPDEEVAAADLLSAVG